MPDAVPPPHDRLARDGFAVPWTVAPDADVVVLDPVPYQESPHA